MFSFLSQTTQRARIQQAFNQLNTSSDNGENYRPAQGVSINTLHQDGGNGVKIEVVQKTPDASVDLLKHPIRALNSYFPQGSSLSAVSWYHLNNRSFGHKEQDLTAIVGLNTFGINGLVAGVNAKTSNACNGNYQNTRVLTNGSSVDFTHDVHYRDTNGLELDCRLKASTLDNLKNIRSFNGTEVSVGKEKTIGGIPVDYRLSLRTDPQQFTSLACLLRPTNNYAVGALATIGCVTAGEERPDGRPALGGALRLVSNWMLRPGVQWNSAVELGTSTIVSTGVRMACPWNQTNCNATVRVPCNTPQQYSVGVSFNIGD